MPLKVKTNEPSLKVTVGKIPEYASVVKNIHGMRWKFIYCRSIPSQNSQCKCPEFNLDSEMKEN